MVVETGVVVGYLIAWVVRKAKRAGGRLDAEVDAAVDAGLDRLHEVVAARLGSEPALADLRTEAADGGTVSGPTRRRVELAVEAAARDDRFAAEVTELVDRLRALHAAGPAAPAGPTAVGPGATAVSGDVQLHAESGSAVAWTLTGGVHIGAPASGPAAPPDPPRPGR